MSTPAKVTIYDEIEARANNIRMVKGYNTTVQEIERGRLKPFSGGDWPKLSFWPLPSTTEPDEYGHDLHTLQVIIGYFDAGWPGDEAFPDFAAKLEADVIHAMNRSTSAPAVSDAVSIDLGGLVESLTPRRIEPIVNEGSEPYCGVLIQVEIKYRAPHGDPVNIDND